MIFVYLSGAILVGMSLVAIFAYATVVLRGEKQYAHVFYAWLYVAVLTVAATLAVDNEGAILQAIITVANLIGAAAMLAVTGRFRAQI
jgi:hypothetical protein